MKNKIIHWMVLIVVFVAASTMASQITLPSNGDNSPAEFYPDVIQDQNVMELRSRNVAGSLRHRFPVFGVDLSSVSDAVTGAVFSVQIAVADADSFTIDVFGVVDGAANETWNPTTLTYNNAPWLNAPNGNIDRGYIAEKVVSLGSISYTAGATGLLNFSSAGLIDFLNADTTGSATLFMEAQVAATGQDFYLQFVSESGTGVKPSLVVETIPEPSTLGMVGLVFTALFGIRRLML